MQHVTVGRGGVLLIVFVVGLLLVAVGFTGRFGLLLGALLTPDYVTVSGQ